MEPQEAKALYGTLVRDLRWRVRVSAPAGAVLGSAGLAGGLVTNMAMAGRNPQWVNQFVTTALPGARAAAMQGAQAASGPGPEPAAPVDRP